MIGTQAFAGPLLPLRPVTKGDPHFHQAKIARRARYSFTTCARSLDSYREGNRFGDPSPPTPRSRPKPKPEAAPKLRVSLSKAMTRMNVASHETCEFMIRSGCVRVNGDVVEDRNARVHRFTDNINVNGTDYGTVDKEENEPVLEQPSDRDRGLLPRTQRDFREDAAQGDGIQKKYSRRVDGGFYSNKKYNYGK